MILFRLFYTIINCITVELCFVSKQLVIFLCSRWYLAEENSFYVLINFLLMFIYVFFCNYILNFYRNKTGKFLSVVLFIFLFIYIWNNWILCVFVILLDNYKKIFYLTAKILNCFIFYYLNLNYNKCHFSKCLLTK